MQIWKTELTVGSGKTSLPKGAKPISIQAQNGTPFMWSIVDPDMPRVDKSFHIAGTGHELPENIGNFVGTFLVESDTLVFHVFELNE